MFELTPFVRRNHSAAAYSPFRDIDELERSFFGRNAVADFKTDITENEKEYILEAELPGFKKEDINIDIDNNYLTISAERKYENTEKDKKGRLIRQERYSGSMSRSFYVGEDITQDEIKAKFENGVLKIDIPKKEPKAKLPESKYIAIA